MFGRKRFVAGDHPTVGVRMTDIGGSPTPIVSITGQFPPGSKGNDVVAESFGMMSEKVDLSRSDTELLVLDFSELVYEFGDHLAGYFWTLPALLDGVGVAVAATGATRENLESLHTFAGSWLPVVFFDTVADIEWAIADRSPAIRGALDLSRQCSQLGHIFLPPETGVNVVIHGSKQTGMQCVTGAPPSKDSDLDIGVVGGPSEMAILCHKVAGYDEVPGVQHPPTRIWNSIEEATDDGLIVIQPRAQSALGPRDTAE